MFKVEKLPLEQLHGNRSQRVRIDGTFRHPDRADNVVSAATDLVKIDATTVTSVEGTCKQDRGATVTGRARRPP